MLKKIWEIWKKAGKFIGSIIGTIISIAVYIAIITPFAIIIKISTDYLSVKKKKNSNWVKRKPIDLTIQDMKEQY